MNLMIHFSIQFLSYINVYDIDIDNGNPSTYIDLHNI